MKFSKALSVFFWAPVILISLFPAFRLLSLLTAVETVVYPEELLRGNIAIAILENAGKSIDAYRPDFYSGGNLIVGFLAAVLFKWFGASLFSLKLVPLLFFFIPSAVLLYRFLNDFFGFRAAVLGGLLFIFPGPALTQMSLAAMGFHSESILFSLGIFYFYYAWKWKEKSLSVHLAMFAFLCGLGIWFTPITAVTAAVCVLSDLADRRWLFRPRNFFIFAGSFTSGYLPGILDNFAHHFETLHYLANGFITKVRYQEGSASFLSAFKSRFFDLLQYQLPACFGFQRFFGNAGPWIGRVHIFFAVLCWAGLAYRSVKVKNFTFTLPVLLYPVMFIFAYCASTYVAGAQQGLPETRYFVPLQLWALVVFAVFCVPKTSVSKMIYGLLLLLGVWSSSGFLFKSEWGRIFQLKGHLSTMEDLNPGLSVENASSETRCYAFSLAGIQASQNRSLENIQSEVGLYSKQDQKCFYSGFAEGFPGELHSPGDIFQLSSADRRFFYHRVLQWLEFLPENERQERLGQFLGRLSEADLRWFYRGAGSWAIAGKWSPEFKELKRMIPQLFLEIPAAHRPDFYWGAGWKMGENLNCDRAYARLDIDRLPGDERLWAEQGFKAVDDFYKISVNCIGPAASTED